MLPERFNEITYKEPVWFHIPAIFDKSLNPFQNNIYSLFQDPKFKRDNVNIVVYGCPNACTWNGGRYITGEVYRIEQIEEMFYNYIFFANIDIQLTFTNSLLEKRDIYDRYGNTLLDIANKYKDHVEVMVVSDILEDHIRNRYPEIRITRSIIKATKPTDDDFKKYYMIVSPKWQNKDKEYIKSLTEKGTIELLADEPCTVNCPRKATHYQAYNKSQLFIQHNDPTFCTEPEHEYYNELMILPEEINDYIDLGVKHFKLSGREDVTHLIESAVEYLIKTNKQREVRSLAYRSVKTLLD